MSFVCILLSLGQQLSYKAILPTCQIEILYQIQQSFSVNSSPQSLYTTETFPSSWRQLHKI